ncbi:MAG: bidirectional hydrogenase complex protein HoxE [Chloroflexota bacterium]|nr:MAG: bidirectional hydrogenase complex protein HoxE [Chloroflexota bacterium]
MRSEKISPPSEDKRWKIVDTTMRRKGYVPSALIEALHSTQEAFGYLDESALRYISASLRVPPSKVYGVATFYHFFTLRPQGKHTCVVCTGTACYIKGASALLQTLDKNFDIKPGETTSDGEISVLTARCLGSCSLAPAAVFDGHVAGNLEPQTLMEQIARLKE